MMAESFKVNKLAVLGHSQKPIVMPHYPHMLLEDRRIWTQFLKSKVVEITEVWYDVHVGKSVPLPLGSSAMEQRISDGLTRKRIDVVCHVGDSFWVVEIKPRASMTALGQVLTYVRLFTIEFDMIELAQAVIICESVDEDLLYQFKEFDVLVYVAKWKE